MKNKVQQCHAHTGHYTSTTHWTPPQKQTINTNYNYIVRVKMHIYVDDPNGAYSNHVPSCKQENTLICHTTMCKNLIHLLYNPGHVIL